MKLRVKLVEIARINEDNGRWVTRKINMNRSIWCQGPAGYAIVAYHRPHRRKPGRMRR